MPRIPSITPKELVDILKKRGFVLDRTKGSHQIFLQRESGKRVVVPMHKKDIPKGTLFSILKQAGLDRDILIES